MNEHAAPSVYPLRVEGELDAQLSRWLWLVKWVLQSLSRGLVLVKWLLALPHYLIVSVFAGGAQGLVLARAGRHGLALPWGLAMPLLFGLGWCASTGIGVSVEDQFTVFGAAGAVLFTLLSGLLLARITHARTPVA
jgi:hypothetical protein